MALRYSASGAAKASGKNVSTITRAIRSGKISATKDDGGAWQIDPAELHRVFPLAPHGFAVPEMQRNASPMQVGVSSGEDALLRQVAALRDDLAEARQRLAVSEAERRSAEALAEDRAQALADLRRLLPPASAAVTPRRRWWPFG